MKAIEKLLDKEPPNDDIQQKMEKFPFLAEYQSKIGITAVSFVCVFLSLIVFYISAKNVPPPLVYLVQGVDKPKPVLPLRFPIQSSTTVRSLARETVQKVYTFNFLNYDRQLGAAKPYFTAEGWEAYRNFIKNSDLLKSIEKNKLSITATPTAEPIIESRAKIPGGAEFAWKVIVPVVVSFTGDTPTQNQNFNVRVLIIRVPTTENPKGLAVQQVIASPSR